MTVFSDLFGSPLLDLDPATLGLADGDPWSGDGTWTNLEWGGEVKGATVNGFPALRCVFTTAPGAVSADTPDLHDPWTLHVVGRITNAPDSYAPGVMGLGRVLVNPDKSWMYMGLNTPITVGVHVLTLTFDGEEASVYLNGLLIGATAGQSLTTSLILGAYGPEMVLDVLRLVLLDEIPATLLDDIAALKAAYGVGGDTLTAHGTFILAGAASLAATEEGDDPWVEPDVPEPTAGGSATPPPAPEATLPPANVPDPILRWVYEDMPAPTTSGGRPANWQPEDASGVDWGRVQIVVEGVDITYLGDVPTPFPTIVEVEPFGWATATIRLPQLTTFRNIGSGSLSWCRQGANVHIRVRKISGGYVDLFRGFVEDPVVAEPGEGVRLECTGLLFQADKTIRPPALANKPKDAGEVIASLLNKVPGRRYTKMQAVATGCRTSTAGSWEPVLTGAVQQLLSTMLDRKGRQWTLMPDGREPVLRRKDTTTIHWTVRNGQRGISVDLDNEMLPNAIYGEGIRSDGGRWRNAKYPNWRPDDTPPWPMEPNQSFRVGTRDSDTTTGAGVSDWQRKVGQPVTGVYSPADREACKDLQREAGIQVDGAVGPQTWAATFGTGSNSGTLDGAFIAPLYAAKKVQPRKYGADGVDLGPNPDYDPDVIRVEDVISFGRGVTKSEAKSWVKRRMSRSAGAGTTTRAYHGTVRFEIDPPEGHRLEVVRAGTNGLIKGVHGQDVQVHVSHVTMQQSGTGPLIVTATVDTEARDYPTLDAIRTRERNAVDPAKAFIKRRGREDVMSDRAIFDAESPAGQVPRHALFANLWTVIRIPFGDYGTIVRTTFRTTGPAAPFALAVFSKPLTAADLLAVVGNPLTAEDNPWSEKADKLEEMGLLMAWGWTRQPCGYYPRSYSTPDGDGVAPVTGRMVDDATWEFASQNPPWLWVAEIASTGCLIEGRFLPGAEW